MPIATIAIRASGFGSSTFWSCSHMLWIIARYGGAPSHAFIEYLKRHLSPRAKRLISVQAVSAVSSECTAPQYLRIDRETHKRSASEQFLWHFECRGSRKCSLRNGSAFDNMSLPPMLDPVRFETVLRQYKADPESVYHTWIINRGDRLKAFRAIRRGVEQVVDR